MKEIFENAEIIKKFKLLHYVMLSHGITYISVPMYIDWDGNVDYFFDPYTNKGSAVSFLPEKFLDFLENFIGNLRHAVLDLSQSYNDSRARIEFEYSTYEKTFSIKEQISVMDYQSSYHEFPIDKKELIEDMVKWKEEGMTKIKVDFSGSGDSGYIDDRGSSGDKNINLPAVWEEELYSILERNHGGWENNEGSEGTFIIDNKNQQIYLDFRMNVETDETGYEFEHKFNF